MRLFRLWSSAVVAGCLFLTAAAIALARADENLPVKRALLFPTKADDVPASLRPFVKKLLSAEQGSVDAADAKPVGVFARVMTRNDVLDGSGLRNGAMLGGKPFVFVTLPEALYGRNLLHVFSTIGYSAEEVLTSQLGEEKVVAIFRWEDKVIAHPGRDGALPDAWSCAVYPATWDNVFSLVDRMAGDPQWNYVGEENQPAVLTKLQLRSPKEGQFLLGFPDAGKQRIKSSSYYALRKTKGADWEYRQLLERSMNLGEHFSGDGTSQATMIGRAKPPAGFPEFLGPNRGVAALAEVAIISLGALSVGER